MNIVGEKREGGKWLATLPRFSKPVDHENVTKRHWSQFTFQSRKISHDHSRMTVDVAPIFAEKLLSSNHPQLRKARPRGDELEQNSQQIHT